MKIFSFCFSRWFVISGVLACMTLCSCGEKKDDKVIRIGHFPNITHVQSLVARNMARQGKGWFEERIPGYTFEWYTYNAGPSAMEAVFARSLDLSYVGPSPAINAYTKSKGSEIRVISGSANGAAALVTAPGFDPKTAEDFIGKRIATPQLGNTQDIACRAWLKDKGFKMTMRGGIAPEGKSNPGPTGVDVDIQPVANPEQLGMMQQKNVDAVWTVEPWVSRLERDAGAKVFLDEKDAITTILVARNQWLKDNPELARKMAEAQAELTDWILAHPEEARKMVVDELSALTKSDISDELIKHAWPRVILTKDVSLPGMEKMVKDAQDAGFLSDVPPLSGMMAEWVVSETTENVPEEGKSDQASSVNEVK